MLMPDHGSKGAKLMVAWGRKENNGAEKEGDEREKRKWGEGRSFSGESNRKDPRRFLDRMPLP